MSYDLFSLTFVPRQEDRTILDLVDPKGVAHYTKRRVPTNEYKIEVYDTLSEGLLASVSAPSATSKHKTLQLHNPDSIVELKSTGVLTFKWSFKWEEHEFEWKREECYLIRKPDPAVLVAQTKEPPGKLQTRNVQILDYNINRFDVNDRKGLEIAILTALLTFSDLNEAHHAPRENSLPVPVPVPGAASASASAPAAIPGSAAAAGLLSPTTTAPSTPISAPNLSPFAAANLPPPLPGIAEGEPPTIPPRPAPRMGVERVAEMHMLRNALGEGDVNEVEVWEECDVLDYAQYAERLLNDEAMLFISIRSASQVQVPKVLKVVEETKRLRHKAGIAEEEELHQYVIYETEKRKGPRRINLDDPDSKKGKPDAGKYAPPTSLTVHLSKIDMPELRPKANPAATQQRRASSSNSHTPTPMPMNTPMPMRPPSSSRSSSSPPRATPQPPPPPPGVPGVLPPMPVAIRELTEKERRKVEKENKKMEKESRKKDKGRRESSAHAYLPSQSLGPPPSSNKLTRPSPSPSPSPHPSYNHTPAHMPHPYQPSPSPSQLGNPSIYAAPPPPSSSSRPRPGSMAFPQPSQGGAAYPPSYLAPAYSGSGGGSGGGYGGRPQSFYGPAGGSGNGNSKGPVSALLHMWSKD